MHPGGQAAAQVVKELIGNALAGGTNGWEAGRGDPASNNEQTAEASADQR
jgi:hypothetical protein